MLTLNDKLPASTYIIYVEVFYARSGSIDFNYSMCAIF